MASVRIHQDLYNYQKKRSGLTGRQWVAVAVAVACVAAGIWLMSWVLGLSTELVAGFSWVFAIPALVCGWMPFWGMNFEEAMLRARKLSKRGNALAVNYEYYEPERSVLTRAQLSKEKKKGYEYRSGDPEDTRKRK